MGLRAFLASAAGSVVFFLLVVTLARPTTALVINLSVGVGFCALVVMTIAFGEDYVSKKNANQAPQRLLSLNGGGQRETGNISIFNTFRFGLVLGLIFQVWSIILRLDLWFVGLAVLLLAFGSYNHARGKVRELDGLGIGVGMILTEIAAIIIAHLSLI